MLYWTQRTRYPLDVDCNHTNYDGNSCISYQRVFNVSACKKDPFLLQNLN